jgi:ADP-ribose pyrophosphatase YjhB (NUDIX family)
MTLEYCADAIAMYGSYLVLIKRLTEPRGIAIPGGRRDCIDGNLEDVYACAVREFKEETGLDLLVEGVLGTFDAEGRDPRGHKISTVVCGQASGSITDEAGKTRVILLNPNNIGRYMTQFCFDHYNILQNWLGRKFL